MNIFKRSVYLAVGSVIVWSGTLMAQSLAPKDAAPAGPSPATPPVTTKGGAAPAPTSGPVSDGNRTVVPPGYVIGADDVLAIFFWRDQDMTRDVVVRPDGKISLPVVNDLPAAGLTPDQLRESITKAAKDLYTDLPTVSIVVKQINSRKVYITGSISKPGAYALMGPMTVAQLIAVAGGLAEYADKHNISVVSVEKKANGTPWRYKFDYSRFLKGEDLKQNIELKPGDTVIVP